MLLTPFTWSFVIYNNIINNLLLIVSCILVLSIYNKLHYTYKMWFLFFSIIFTRHSVHIGMHYSYLYSYVIVFLPLWNTMAGLSYCFPEVIQLKRWICWNVVSRWINTEMFRSRWILLERDRIRLQHFSYMLPNMIRTLSLAKIGITADKNWSVIPVGKIDKI